MNTTQISMWLNWFHDGR